MLNTLPLEAMSYKQQISMGKEQELLTKLRIIRLVKRHGRKRVQAAEQFQCHRNTIGNILNQFINRARTPSGLCHGDELPGGRDVE